MNYAHLLWAIADSGLAQYRLAEKIGCSESHFSRCLYGRSAFTTDERTGIAAILGYPERWLFEEVDPPARKPVAELVQSAVLMNNF